MSETRVYEAEPASSAAAADTELSVLDVLIVIAKHKRIIFGVPLVAAVIAAIYSLMLPNVYTGTTKLLPPQQSQSVSASILSQLGGLAGLGGLPAPKSATDLYMGMLKSRTVADSLIRRFDLMKKTGAPYMSKARDKLAAVTSVSAGKDGIITIEVDDQDPAHAATLANAYVEELLRLTQVLAVTEASQRRLFFERQFARAKENLAATEAAARQALDRGGLVKVDEQGRAMIQTNARLRAQMTVKEVQIGAMRTFAAESNPDIHLAEQELDAMRRELAKMEGSGGAVSRDSTSGKGLENVRLLRDLKYNETLYELLAKQYEMARIDEAKDSAVVQVMDIAIEPDRKSKPRRGVIVLLTIVGTFVLAVVWAFMHEALTSARTDSKQAPRLQALKRYMALR